MGGDVGSSNVQCIARKAVPSGPTVTLPPSSPPSLPSLPSPDYRLNYRLNKACFHDVKKLQCIKECEGALEAGDVTCGGKVLKCLSSNKDKIQSEACQKEVFSFEKLEVTDIRLDVPLQVGPTQALNGWGIGVIGI